MKNNVLLLSILFLGLFVRLYGYNWDQGWHLHPDERFLTMVGVDVTIPSQLSAYLDQKTSSFNPANKGHAFYVYGTFPVLLNKLVAQYVSADSYDLFNLQGRLLSGIADFFVIVVIYKLVELVEKQLKLPQSTKYLSAFLYAVAVLPIQLSHFFTVDTFLNLFCWLSLYFAACSMQHVTRNIRKWSMLHVTRYMCLSGLFLGLALACKVSTLYFAPLVGIFVLIGVIPAFRPEADRPLDDTGMTKILFSAVIFFVACYLALRLGSPYYFETNNLFNPQLNSVFLNNIQTLKSFDNPAILFPPATQWIHASPFLSLINLVVFGVGPCYFLFSLIGIVQLLKTKNKLVYIVIAWCFLFLIYQSLQFAKTMRYVIFLYPFLAIFAAVGFLFVIKKINSLPKPSCYMLHATCYMLILFWPLAFMSIYTKEQSRVAASKWIEQNIPSQSVLTYEYWDDPLPLAIQTPSPRSYTILEVHIFDPDTKEKWNVISTQLAQADYYIMSSNRGWGSIPTAPEKYPLASQFYKDMFEGKKGFKLIKEFSSYPSLRYAGIPLDFPDQWAEEAFTVYDHPLVYIFKKTE